MLSARSLRAVSPSAKWRHVEPRQGMWKALDGLPRFIATTVAKHRLFVWFDAGVCADHQLIVIARDDDVTLGILHGRFHEPWSIRLGTSLEDRPRYTPTTTFGTSPFPDGLAPYPRRRVRGRAARRRHRRTSSTCGRASRPLAQSARMGGVGGGTSARLSEAPGRPRRGGGEGTQIPHADQPLQSSPAMARRCACGIRCRRRGRLRVGHGYHRKRCACGIARSQFKLVEEFADHHLG